MPRTVIPFVGQGEKRGPVIGRSLLYNNNKRKSAMLCSAKLNVSKMPSQIFSSMKHHFLVFILKFFFSIEHSDNN